MKTGDVIAAVATPIARVLGLPCIDPDTKQLRPESGCARMKNNLNAGMNFADAIYDRFWPQNNNQQKDQKQTMQFIVMRQITIESETPEEALEKTRPQEGVSVSFSVNPRPQMPTQTPSKPALKPVSNLVTRPSQPS